MLSPAPIATARCVIALALFVGLASIPVARAESADAEDATTKTVDAADSDGAQPASKVKARKSGWAVLPGISYSPDASLTLAASALRFFAMSESAKRPSSIRFSAEYSLRGNREFVLLPELWLDRDRYNTSLKVKSANVERSYFGVGADSQFSDRERYRDERVEMRARFAREVAPDFYVALVYDLVHQTISEAVDGGEIRQLELAGEIGGNASGAGFELLYDTRDDVFWPTSGVRVLATARGYSGALYSDYSFVTAYYEGRYFYGLAFGHVVAVDSQVEFRSDGAGIDNLALIGGSRSMRGMLKGRYRDRLSAVGQVEYRAPLWWRLGAVVFVGGGGVSHGIGDLDPGNLTYSLGAGLRLRLSESGINARFDVAASDGETGAYLNLLEAF